MQNIIKIDYSSLSHDLFKVFKDNSINSYKIVSSGVNDENLEKVFNSELFKNCEFKKDSTLSSKKTLKDRFYFIDYKNKVLVYYNSIYNETYIYYCKEENLNQYLEVLDVDNTFIFSETPPESNISVLMSDGNELYLETIKNDRKELAFENYNIGFKTVHEDIVKSLKEKSRGIIILHGEPGTGKTNYISTLCKYSDKKFIYVPPFMVSMLGDPSFLAFIVQQSNSVLIVEDAESVLISRNQERNSIVSNLLNVSDGILSELLNLQIICTVNCDLQEIDSAVLRPGRLLHKYEFKKLEVNECNDLLKVLGKPQTAKEPMTLAEVYNGKNDNVKERKEIGFKV